MELLAALAVAALGYLAGSVPGAGAIARGMPAAAGPGWALLARTGELAKGVLPVALAAVTWSWGAGWLAGSAAVVGSRRPLRRDARAAGAPLLVLAGAAAALAPPAALLALVPAGLSALLARLLGRPPGVAGLVAGGAAFGLLFPVVHPEAARVAALGVLLLAGLLPPPARLGLVRRRPHGPARPR